MQSVISPVNRGKTVENTLLCCDWGTSSFRLRWVDIVTQQVLHEVRSDDGIAATFSAWKSGSNDRMTVYRQVLGRHINRLAELTGHSLDGVHIVVSGMASSSIGILELPYAPLPFPTDGHGACVERIAQTDDFRHDILLISGVRGEQDVMRGEETQLIGLYALRNDKPMLGSEELFILPGTHSKHIQVLDGSITNFWTYMTGEQFGLLARHGILSDSVNRTESLPVDLSDEDWDWFRKGVQQGATSNLLHALFSVRINQLLGQVNKAHNYQYLSGLLIGSELKAIGKAAQPLVLCSGNNLYPFYQQAMQTMALNFSIVSPDVIEKAAVAGQVAIFRHTYLKTLARNF